MVNKDTKVTYRAVADFAALTRALTRFKKNLAEVKAAEDAFNASSVTGADKATSARGRHAKATEDDAKATRSSTSTIRESTVQFVAEATAIDKASTAHEGHAREAAAADRVNKQLAETLRRTAREQERTARATDSSSQAFRRNRTEQTALGRNFTSTIQGSERLNKSLVKLGNWRPRLTPPFIALIPILGGILALINPLVAGLGAVGVAGLGFASSLASISGAAVSVVPGLAALLSMVFALKTAFGGIGNVFKAFTAQKNATTAGGGAGSAPAKAELTQLEEVARAQENYRRAIEDVQDAEEDLDESRKDAVKRLEQLRKAVQRAASAEASARAGAQLSRENYANVMADPGSTKGDKMEAAAQVAEADEQVEDVLGQNKENADDLAKAQQDGIEGDKQVIASQRRLTDALNAQRDAQLALINAQNGSGGAVAASSAAATAADEYQKALAKLSPSARAFVLALIGMQAQWELLQRTVQESFFSEIIGQVGDLNKLFPVLTDLLSRSAGAAGRVASRFIAMATSAEWLSDIGKISEQNVPMIENVGDALLYILDGLKDIAIAAGPFATALTEGFKTGADNFRNLVAGARESGSLADWLDTVLGRMQQWWRIIKNIGGTLFNYGAATSEFGKWLTDGFEKVTEGWLKSSEAARQAGSPFQQYLEDVKPLLTEVKNLFATFFKWFGKTASDPENIDEFTNLIKMIREDLGPALADIFDTLSKSGAGESLVEAIIAIVEAIDTFLKNGGIDGIKAFYGAIVALANGFRDFVAVMPPGFISALTTGFGILAALRFSGMTSLITGLIALGKSKGLLSVLDKLPGIGAMGSTGRHAATRGAAGAAGRGVAGAAGGAAAGGAFSKAMKFITSLGGRVTPSAGANAGRGFNLLGSIGKGAGKGAGLGVIASILGTVAGDAISSGAVKGDKGAGQRVGGNTLSGAASGAGIGALVGSVVPGLGTAVGAVAGGAIGAGVGALSSDKSDIDSFNDDTNGMLEDFWKNTGGMFADFFTNVGKWWDDNVSKPFNEVATNVGKWWNENVVTPFVAFVGAVQRGWHELIEVPLTNFASVVGTWWDENVAVPLSDFALTVGTWWTDNIATPLSDFALTVGTWWTDNIATPLGDFATTVGTWWTDNIATPLGDFSKSVGTWWDTNIGKPLNTFATTVGSWWQTNVAQPLSNFAAGVTQVWKERVTDPFNTVIGGIKKAWADFLNFDLSETLTSFFNGMFKGGDASRSNKTGASQGGATLARVKSILPKGLGVTSTYRTPAENRAVGGVPNSYHTDKANPAVDIAGSVGAMDQFAAVLRKMGGWRQLLYKVPGHYDHIHVAHNGGTVSNSWPRSPGDKQDERTTRLQVGEVVVPKSEAAPFSGSVVPGLPPMNPSGSGSASSSALTGTHVVDTSTHIGDVHIYNPTAEPSSESLPRSLRKVAYLGAK
jgi:hypothetical protein